MTDVKQGLLPAIGRDHGLELGAGRLMAPNHRLLLKSSIWIPFSPSAQAASTLRRKLAGRLTMLPVALSQMPCLLAAGGGGGEEKGAV
jgi:hypothetical protein